MTTNPAPRDTPLASLLGPFEGARIAGGCEHCDAYQTVQITAGVWEITIHHDDDCPDLGTSEETTCPA